MKKLIVGLAVLLITSGAMAQSFEDIKWMTEEYPPYNFVENGVKKGIGIDILLEVWKRIGLNKSPDAIKVWPWNKGVKTIKTKPNTCLFSTTLTAERRDKFGWKYVLSIPQIVEEGAGNHLIVKKDSTISFASMDAIKNYKKKFGVSRGDVGASLLAQAGVPKSQMDEASSPDSLIKKFLKGRFEVLSYGMSTVRSLLEKMGEDPQSVKAAFTFPPSPMGYAFHKDTDPALLKKFQKALDEINADGTAAKIKAKYAK